MTNQKPFVLNDEQVNSYGFKVLTSGINLERFKSNPVMLMEHDRSHVIGKWEHLEIVGNQLLAAPLFDVEDEKALSISKKVEKGFINGASISINVLEMDTSGDVPVAIKSEMFEASICSIPSNRNALKVIDEKGKLMSDEDVLVKLSLPNMSFNLNHELSKVLGISSANERQLIDEVKKLKQKPIDELIKKSINEGRILAGEKESFVTLLSQDFESGKQTIERLPKKKMLTDMYSTEPSEYPKEWTLQDYREKAPGYLKKNRAFYLELVEKDKTNN